MKRLFLTSALVTMLCASAFATLGDGGSEDKQVLTSLYYTDANYANLSNFNSLSTTVGGKQDKIPATTSTYVYNSTNNASADGSVVTTNTLGATGERGIARAVVSNGSGGYTNDNWLPTVGAMMAAINAHTPTALTWTSTETTAAGNYSTTFDGTTGNWPTADADKLIDATGLATALSNKQNKIGATSDGTNNSPNYVYNQSTNPSADGSVVTTGATDGATGERGIANQAVYTTTNNVTTLSNGHWVANVEFVETKQDKKVCAGYEPGHDNDPSYCWLWVLPN